MNARVGAILWIVASAAYFSAEAIAATGMPGYSYATDYISTLGEPARSPHAALMNAAFVVQAILFPAGAHLLSREGDGRKRQWFMVFAVLNGVGNILVAVVHSGSGAWLHVVGAALAIGGGNAAVIAGARSLRMVGWCRTASLATGALGILGLLAAAIELQPIGAWERVGGYAIFAWQTVTGIAVLVGRRRPYPSERA